MAKDVANKVKKMVVDHLGVEETKVTDEASFNQVLVLFNLVRSVLSLFCFPYALCLTPI